MLVNCVRTGHFHLQHGGWRGGWGGGGGGGRSGSSRRRRRPVRLRPGGRWVVIVQFYSVVVFQKDDAMKPNVTRFHSFDLKSCDISWFFLLYTQGWRIFADFCTKNRLFSAKTTRYFEAFNTRTIHRPKYSYSSWFLMLHYTVDLAMFHTRTVGSTVCTVQCTVCWYVTYAGPTPIPAKRPETLYGAPRAGRFNR